MPLSTIVPDHKVCRCCSARPTGSARLKNFLCDSFPWILQDIIRPRLFAHRSDVSEASEGAKPALFSKQRLCKIEDFLNFWVRLGRTRKRKARRLNFNLPPLPPSRPNNPSERSAARTQNRWPFVRLGSTGICWYPLVNSHALSPNQNILCLIAVNCTRVNFRIQTSNRALRWKLQKVKPETTTAAWGYTTMAGTRVLR